MFPLGDVLAERSRAREQSVAKKHKETKTNAIREVEAAGLPCKVRAFECEGVPSGVEVAALLGLDPARVFKTLVTVGKSGEHFVFMVPVAEELDLKRAAKAVGEKSIEMIRSRELLPLTGYVHGGCSPIGMKRQFRTVADETAQLFDTIFFSAGRIGCQLEMAPDDLAALISPDFADLTVR